MGLSQFDERSPLLFWGQITAAELLAHEQIVPVEYSARRIDAILLTSTDTAARVIDLYVPQLGTDQIIGSVNVPAGSGYNGLPPVDMVAAIFAGSNGQLVLGPGQELLIGAETDLTAAKVVNAQVFGGYV